MKITRYGYNTSCGRIVADDKILDFVFSGNCQYCGEKIEIIDKNQGEKSE